MALITSVVTTTLSGFELPGLWKRDFTAAMHAVQNRRMFISLESVPELIMKVYPWIHGQESALQQEVDSPGLNDKDKDRISEEMTDKLIQRLDPDDDAVWADEPRWVKHLQSD